MFRGLLPLVARDYHVIALDHLVFGLSDALGAAALTDLTAGLLAHLGIERYAMYVQDYGAPIGWRLALRDPGAIAAIVTQNGNGYEAGFVPEFWAGIREYHRDRNPRTEAAMREAL